MPFLSFRSNPDPVACARGPIILAELDPDGKGVQVGQVGRVGHGYLVPGWDKR